MTTITVTIPDIKVELTVEQLVAAVRQLEPGERAAFARAIADTELDQDLAQLIEELYSHPPVAEISNADILAEVRAVRQRGR